MFAARSDCMYHAYSYNLHSINSQISTWAQYRLDVSSFDYYILLCGLVLYELHQSYLLASAMRVAKALATYNQPNHHKTFPIHGVTKPTPTSWYCELLHYFADLDRLNS